MKKQTEEEQRNKDTKQQSKAHKEGKMRMRGGKEERKILYNFNSVKTQTITTYISRLCCLLH